MTKYSTYLFARPSVLEGVARLIDVGGTLNEYNTSSTPGQSDARALRSDWLAVGADLEQAIETFEREQSQETLRKLREAVEVLKHERRSLSLMHEQR